MFKKGRLGKALLLGAVVAILIQFVPYGRSHSNPPGRTEPAWDRAATRELARRACFDCHSNETLWPAYSRVAPISWFLQHDVDEGRQALNFSEWQRPQDEAKEAAQVVREREMPPWTYTILHPDARLSAQDQSDLITGLEATIGREFSQDSTR